MTETQRRVVTGLLERAIRQALESREFGLEAEMRQIRDVVQRA